MPPSYVMTTRLSRTQHTLLQELQKKLGLSKNDILRLALMRFAEAEGIVTYKPHRP